MISRIIPGALVVVGIVGVRGVAVVTFAVVNGEAVVNPVVGLVAFVVVIIGDVGSSLAIDVLLVTCVVTTK
jgi:hypothetical protein